MRGSIHRFDRGDTCTPSPGLHLTMQSDLSPQAVRKRGEVEEPAHDEWSLLPPQRPKQSTQRLTECALSSASLLASSASSAEIAAVWAGLPQLGASLPSPQAFGR
jgi:hypothetical protein